MPFFVSSSWWTGKTSPSSGLGITSLPQESLPIMVTCRWMIHSAAARPMPGGLGL